MDAHRLGISLAAQFPAAVLEVADQFLLLGVDGNRWITGDDCRLYRGIDVFELCVPVGVVGSLTRLAVSLTAVLLLAQQPADQLLAHPPKSRQARLWGSQWTRCWRELDANPRSPVEDHFF